jgi:hypothetical protein
VLPLHVNDSYIAVGWGASSAGGGAVVSRDGSIFDLNDLIGDVLPHRLTDAVSIDDRGQIVAWARPEERTLRSYGLTPDASPAT